MTKGYSGLQGVRSGKRSYKGLKGFINTGGYKGLKGFINTGGYKGLHGVIKGLLGDTEGYRWSHWVTRAYKRVQGITGCSNCHWEILGLKEVKRGYKGLQGISRDWKGLQRVKKVTGG